MAVIINKTQKGIGVIEILIVIGILAITLISLFGLINLSLRLTILAKETTLANALSQEAMEAVRNIRDSDWTKIVNGNYGLTNKEGYWDFSGNENVINGFARIITIENVSRNPETHDIEDIYNSGNDDPDTKKITVAVSWKDREVKITTYLTNWR